MITDSTLCEKNNEINVELWTNGEDIDIGDDLFQLFEDDFIYIYKQLYFWNSNVNRWVKDEEKEYILDYIINKITQAYDKYLTSKDYFNIMKNGDEISKKLQDVWRKSKKLKQMKNIKPIRERFINRLINRFDKIEFDMNPYLIAFDNKVYDFETKKFRTAKKTDYISMNTNYNYEPPTTEQKKTIKEIIESIFPDEEQRRCYMSVLYNGLIDGFKLWCDFCGTMMLVLSVMLKGSELSDERLSSESLGILMMLFAVYPFFREAMVRTRLLQRLRTYRHIFCNLCSSCALRRSSGCRPTEPHPALSSELSQLAEKGIVSVMFVKKDQGRHNQVFELNQNNGF